MIDKTKALDDKILLGYAFRKLTMKTVDECFFHCYEDCFCMAFQMCQSTECQLLSTNQFQSSSALVTMKGCSYYDMLPDFEQVKKFTAVDGLWNFRTQISAKTKLQLSGIEPVALRFMCSVPTKTRSLHYSFDNLVLQTW
jgi:hypothetical protein